MNRRMSDQIRQFALVNCRGIVERPTFGRFGFRGNRCSHGSIYLLLLWGCLCIANLCNTALATDQDIVRAIEENRALLQGTIVGSQATTDGAIGDVKGEVFNANSHLSYIEASAENIETDVEYIDRHVGTIMNDLADLQSSLSSGDLHNLFQRIETNTRTNNAVDLQPIIDEVSKLQKNLGWLVSGSALEDDDGEGYPNRITSTHFGNSSITMSDALQFIAQGVGGIDTSGNPSYQSQAMMPLINTIIGWSGGFADNNIKTNGIIGLLRQVNKTVSELYSITNLVVDKIDEQINIISNGFARLAYLGSENAWLMTNQIFMSSGYTGLPNKNNNFGAFMRAWQRSESFNGSPPSFPDEYSQPYWGGLLTLPYYTLPLEEADIKTMYEDRSPYFPEQGNIEELRKAFYQFYGNMRTLAEATADAGLDSELDSEVDEVKSHYTNESEEIDFDLQNNIAPILQGPWGQPNQQLNSVKRDTHIENSINNFKHLVDDALTEEQETGGFGFSISFDSSGEGGADVEFQTDTLFADENFLSRVKTELDQYLDYIAWIVKGGMILMLGWRSATTAMNVIGDGSI